MQGRLLAEKLNCVLDAGDQLTGMEAMKQYGIEENLASTFVNVKDVIGKLYAYKDGSVSQEEEVDITIWDGLFKKAEIDLNLDNLCKLLSETFGSIVSLITYVLGSVLADLFTKGFGISKNDEDDGAKDVKSENAEGTGMGDGVGAEGRGRERGRYLDEALGKDKGIEISDELDGNEYSVSEDSEEDNEDEKSGDELDSVMGDAGSDAEKPWDKDEDDEAGDMNEKIESGPSVDDKDSKTGELRAKDDDVDTADEPEESNTSKKQEEGNDENGDPDNLGDTENLEDKIQNKEEALVDQPGLTPDVGNEQIEDMENDETDEAEKEAADQQED